MKFLENSKSLKEIGHNYQLPSKASHFARNTQRFYLVFRSLDTHAVGYSPCWVFRTVTLYIYNRGEAETGQWTHSELLNKFVTYMQPEDPDSEQDTFSK